MHSSSIRGAVLLEAALLLALAGTIATLSQLRHAVAERDAVRQFASPTLAMGVAADSSVQTTGTAGGTTEKKEQVCGMGNGEQMKGYKYTHTVRVNKSTKAVSIDIKKESYGTSATQQNTLSTCIIKYCPAADDDSGCITLKKVTAGEKYQDPKNVEDVAAQTAASTDGKTNFEQVKDSFGLSDQQLADALNSESKDLDSQIASEKAYQANIQKQLDNLRGSAATNENITQQERLQNELQITQQNIADMQQQNANLKSNMSSLASSPLNPYYNSPSESGPGPGVGAGTLGGQGGTATAGGAHAPAGPTGNSSGWSDGGTGSYSGNGGQNSPSESGPGPGVTVGGGSGNPTVTQTPVYGQTPSGGGGSIFGSGGGIGEAIGQALGGLLGGLLGGGGGGGSGSGSSSNPCMQWPGTSYSQSSGRCECPSGKTWNGSVCLTIDTTDPSSTVLAAEFSCAPAIQELNKPISLSWTCRNANASGSASEGNGFSTNGAASGTISDLTATSTATTTLSLMHFGLTCKKGSETKQASCDIQTVKPFAVLVAVPSEVTSGATANLAWVTGGMRNTSDACTLTSDGDATFSKQGLNSVAESHAIATSTTFTLRCTSAAGYSHEYSIDVGLK